jgi:PDZ domain
MTVRSRFVGLPCHWLRLFVGAAGVTYLVAVGIGWVVTAVHGDYGLRDASQATDGQMIVELAADGAASRAGLRPGDVILDVDGMPASDADAYWQAVLKTPRRAGEHASLVVRRALPSVNEAYGDAPRETDLSLDSGLANPASVHRALSYSLVGLLLLATVSGVALARPAEAAARILLMTGVCAAFALVTAVIGSLAEDLWIARGHYALAAMTVAGALHLSLVFPAVHPLFGLKLLGRPIIARRGTLVALNYAVVVLLSVALAGPTAGQWLYPLLTLWMGAACGLMLASYQHASTSLARAQLRWIFWGLTVCAGSFVLGSVVPSVTHWAIVPLPDWAAVGSFALFPGAIGVAILRYRLFDIDVIINRTLVYGSLTAVLAGLFAGLSILSQRLVLAVTGQESQAAVVLAALAVTALFQPLRVRVQTLVDRRFYRRKYDAGRTLEQFASQLRDEVELDHLTDRLVAVVQDTMQPAHVSLWLRSPVGGTAVRVGERR